jgi:hypothetical protein
MPPCIGYVDTPAAAATALCAASAICARHLFVADAHDITGGAQASTFLPAVRSLL